MSNASSRMALITRNCAEGSGATGAIGTVSPRWQTQPEGRDTRIRGRPITWCQHPHRVTVVTQCSRECQHLRLHAAGHSQAVGANQTDAHHLAKHKCATFKCLASVGARPYPTLGNHSASWGTTCAIVLDLGQSDIQNSWPDLESHG